MQGGWGPKHLGDSGRHQRAKQIAADIEACPEEIAKAYKWFNTASKLTQAKPPRDLPLARLVRDGNDHIRTVEAMVTPENACVFEERIRKWKALVAAWENHRRVAAGEAEVLPDAFTAAAAWFGTAKRSTSTDARTLGKLASVGNRHINAVLPLSSYPRGSRLTIAWRCLKWKYQISCWEVAALEASLHALRDARIWVKIRDTEKCLVRAKQYRDEACQRLEHFKPTWLKHRAEQRKKKDVYDVRQNRPELFASVRLLRRLPAFGRPARRPPAVLQRGVSTVSLARGAHARVPARGRAEE